MLNLQPLCVVVSLPHASAETSNTDSNRRDGVLYGFFPVAGSGIFPFELFSLLNCPSQDSFSRLLLSQTLPEPSASPPGASPLDHANISRGMADRARLCGDVML